MVLRYLIRCSCRLHYREFEWRGAGMHACDAFTDRSSRLTLGRHRRNSEKAAVAGRCGAAAILVRRIAEARNGPR